MLTFYIIYTPDTVRLLSFFVKSLLYHSDCNFCLVSNACREDEDTILRQMCVGEKRLSFLKLPTEKMWSHGEALNYLFHLNKSDYFCFMDSDIFATGKFLTQFEPLIEKNAGVFSCSSLWMRDEEKAVPDSYPILSGRYNRTSDGICLGSSYFAIYNCKKINALIEKSSIDLNNFFWKDLPVKHQKEIAELGLQRKRYDTCRVFNLRLLSRGEQLHFEESKHLVHIGGISAKTARNELLANKHLAKILYKLPESYLKQQLLRIAAFSIKKLHLVYKKRMRHRTLAVVRKAVVNRYFSQLLESLLENSKPPKLPKLMDKETQHKLEEASEALKEMHVNLANLTSRS